MKRPVAIAVGVIAFAAIFGALRLYGAYQSEVDSALRRAAEAENQAAFLEAEEKQLKWQNECNALWQKYKVAQLEKEIAELRGQAWKTPTEPSCTGYAPQLDEVIDRTWKAAEAGMQAISLREYAELERHYAVNRKLQTKFIGLRAWAFVTGTEVKQKQAEMERDHENAAGSRNHS